MIRVLVVDDHTIFRSGLRRLLGDEDDLRVTAEAPGAAEALQVLRGGGIDVVILDINLKGRSGLDLLKTLHRDWPALPVLMMSMFPQEQFARAALEAGARAYLSKDAEPGELLAALRRLAAGGTLEPTDSRLPAISAEAGATPGAPHLRLSAREMQILLAIVAGKSLTDIGAEIFLSVKTVSTYRGRILDKLQLASNSDLVRYALQHGLTA